MASKNKKNRFEIVGEVDIDEDDEVDLEIVHAVFDGLMMNQHAPSEVKGIKKIAEILSDELMSKLSDLEDDSDLDEDSWDVFCECFTRSILPVVSQLSADDIKHKSVVADTVSTYALARWDAVKEAFGDDEGEDDEDEDDE